MGESGTIDRKRFLIRLRPFMYGVRWHPQPEVSHALWGLSHSRSDQTNSTTRRRAV